jgi:disulfide bond formation protein DsbB
VRIPSLRLLFDYAAQGPDKRAAVLFGLSAATIGGAWFSEYGLGYIPCKLCLLQRWPYYFGVPLAAFAWVIAGPMKLRLSARPAFAMLAAIFMVSVALGVHHAGVEWSWWQGPADCGGKIGLGPQNVGDLLTAINNTRLVSCTEAPFRILGLSLAGWNALVSFLMATIAIRGWRGSRYVSSSVSQYR